MIKAKFDAKQDADRLRSVARGLSYNAVSEAVWKHVILEIAMRLESGGYCEKQDVEYLISAVEKL